MTKNQTNHRNITPGKVSSITTARPTSHQKKPSSNETQHQTSGAKQSDTIQKQQKIIEELLDRLGTLVGTVTILSQSDVPDEYSHRSCMIVRGL